MNEAFPKWVENTATIATIIGFFITLYVMWGVRSIRLSYLQRARLPEIHQSLSEAGTQISRILSASSTFDARGAQVQLKIASALIETLVKLANNPDKRRYKRSEKIVWKAVVKIESARGGIDETWAAYGEVQMVLASVDQAIKSSKWD